MQKTICIFALTLLPASAAVADDIKLQDGRVLKDAKIVSHTPSTATIIDEDGGATVPMEQLPPDLQKQLGYNPASAKAFTDAEDEQSRYTAARKKYLMLKGRLVPAGAIQLQQMGVKLIGPAQGVKSDAGDDLGSGVYCQAFHLVEEHVETYTPDMRDSAGDGQAGMFMGNPSSSSQKVPAAWVPDGKVFLVNATLPSGASQMVTVQGVAGDGKTEDGPPYFFLVTAPTIAEWRAAGSPQ